MAKTFICHCEDVTVDDLQDAFEAGYRDLESLKRYTGFATGLCQGKRCTAHAARFLASLRGGDDVVADPPRTRPLLHPVEVAAFAGPDAGASGSDGSAEEER